MICDNHQRALPRNKVVTHGGPAKQPTEDRKDKQAAHQLVGQAWLRGDNKR